MIDTMKVIDARGYFLQRRAENEAKKLFGSFNEPLHDSNATVTSIFSKSPHSRSRNILDSDLYKKRKYLEVVSSRNALLQRIDEIDSFAHALKIHSDVLARESKETLRQLKDVLLLESRARSRILKPDGF